MTVSEVREKCKSVVRHVPRDILIIAVLILSSSLSFGLGYLTGSDARIEKGSSITLDEAPHAAQTSVSSAPQAASTTIQVVASKNGTKYYLPGCAGASRISTTNKVSFASIASARAAGYTPAANCKGI